MIKKLSGTFWWTARFLLIFHLSSLALADVPAIQTKVGAIETSDGFNVVSTRIEVTNARRDPFWPYPNEQDSAFDFNIAGEYYRGTLTDLDYTGQKIAVGPGIKFSKQFQIHGKVGWHVLRRTSQEEESELTYDVSTVISSMDTRFHWFVEHTHDFAHTTVLQNTIFAETLTMDSSSTGFTLQPWSRFMIRTRGTFAEFSDTNRKLEGSALFLFGIMPSTPWWWAGVSITGLSYEQDVPDYWSPEDFYSYGLHSELSVPFSDMIAGSLTAAVTRMKENDNEPGLGGSGSVGLTFGKRESWQARVSYDRIESRQEGSAWTQEGVNAQIFGSF